MDEYVYATAQRENQLLKITQDIDPISPREWDNLGHMICFHRNYELGDKHELTVDELLDIVNRKDVIALPLWLYDHSGLRIKVGDFYGLLPQGHARFDTMKVGFIYVTLEEVRENFGVKRVTRQWREQAIQVLKGEVEDYDTYLRGDVWAFTLYDVKTCNLGEEHLEFVDGCGGFYGTDFLNNGLVGHIGMEWAEELESV